MMETGDGAKPCLNCEVSSSNLDQEPSQPVYIHRKSAKSASTQSWRRDAIGGIPVYRQPPQTGDPLLQYLQRLPCQLPRLGFYTMMISLGK